MNLISRRGLLSGVMSGALAATARHAVAHNNAGPVTPPQAPPPLSLRLADDTPSSLVAVASDRVTALQLMFTSCQATCPIQGAVFGEAAKLLGDRVKPAQLLSVSIDPGQDSPARLREWMQRFGATPRWRAGRPEKAQLDAFVSFLKSSNPGPDPHTPQVYYFDRKAQLVMRSVDFPKAADIVKTLEQIASKK